MKVDYLSLKYVNSVVSHVSKPILNNTNAVKDVVLKNLYSTNNIGKLKVFDKFCDVQSVGMEHFSINEGNKQIGFLIQVPRMYEGKNCYSVAELRNLTDKEGNGIGTKLLQIALKCNKDSGMTGELRAHDVLLEAEEFYEKLGFVEDTKRPGQWYLPKENEHILEQGRKHGELKFYN